MSIMPTGQSPTFETLFRSELLSLTSDAVKVDGLWQGISKAYRQPARHYHNMQHLNHLAAELLPVRNHIEDWQTLVLAIAYHDFVYKIPGGNNEIESACMVAREMRALGLSEERSDNCCLMIYATKYHQQSPNSDINYFVDADLAIFGAQPEAYRQYAAMIRKEYRIYPDFLYKRGRRKALLGFLNRKFIYNTKHFGERYEAQARQNIAGELDTL